MDPILVALLTLVALAVGIFIPVMLYLWLTLKKIQDELRDAHNRFDPVIAEVQSAVVQVKAATQITSAIAVAVTAGVQAWRESKQHAAQETP